MKRFFLTELAEQDLNGIWAYIARDDIRAADRVERQIYEAIRKLVRMPTLGHEHPLIPSDELRVWPVYSYLIIYLPSTKPLQVVRILHGSRNLGRILGFDEEE